MRSPFEKKARGAALLLVLVAIAVITAIAATVAYDTRVSLEIAGNGRDELRAEYLAKSGVNLSRLVLSFQDRLNGLQGLAGALGQPGGSSMAPQLWKVVPVNSALLTLLFAGNEGVEAEPPPEGAATAAPARRAFGDFEGAFEAKLENEGTKVNAQLDSSYANGLLGAQWLAFVNLIEDRRWDPLFDREDENGFRVSRADLPVYLYDWVDQNNSTAVVTGNPAKPFEDGSGDENQPYDRGPDRYKAKNARFDSLEELHLVAGVSDAFMAAFGDQLTVYLPRDEPMALPCDDTRGLVRYATLLANPPGQPQLSNPEFPKQLQDAARDATSNCVLTLTPQAFTTILSSLGIGVAGPQAVGGASKILTTSATVFTVRATGSVGAVTKRLEAVVSFNKAHATPGATAQPLIPGLPQAGNLGRILHWREE